MFPREDTSRSSTAGAEGDFCYKSDDVTLPMTALQNSVPHDPSFASRGTGGFTTPHLFSSSAHIMTRALQLTLASS